MAISDELKKKFGVGGSNIAEILNNAGGKGANIAEAIKDLPSGGGEGESLADALAMGEPIELIGKNATYVSDGNIYWNLYSQLSKIVFPKVSEIGASAFAELPALTTIEFPEATTIGSGAFRYCTSLTTAICPNVTVINASAFTNCTNLTSAAFPKLVSVENSAFYECSNLDFRNFNFSNISYIGNKAFAGCEKLESVTLSENLYMLGDAFSGCTKLMTVDMTECKYMPRIEGEPFTNTPMTQSTYTGSFGNIYVPSQLYSSFVNHTFWRTYSSRFISV